MRADGEKMFTFVDGKFRWETNARRLLEFLEGITAPADISKPENAARKPSPLFHMRWAFWQAREFVRNTLRKAAGR